MWPVVVDLVDKDSPKFRVSFRCKQVTIQDCPPSRRQKLNPRRCAPRMTNESKTGQTYASLILVRDEDGRLAVLLLRFC